MSKRRLVDDIRHLDKLQPLACALGWTLEINRPHGTARALFGSDGRTVGGIGGGEPEKVEHAIALGVARRMIDLGAPVFVARPALKPSGKWDPVGGTDGCGYWLPTGWQQTKPDPSVLDAYEPGCGLGMVCGQGLDGVDTDPRNGGDDERAALNEAGIMPTTYAKARTPSGGTHELIASLGVRKGTPRPGIDVQAGDGDGQGRGFLWIAPTVKAAKTAEGKSDPKNLRRYEGEWVDFDRFEEDHESDGSGEELADLVGRDRPENNNDRDGEPGPEYAEMPVAQRESIDRWITGTMAGIADELEQAKTWPTGYRDGRNRGWEKLTADACYRLGELARAPWNRLTFQQCHDVLRRHAPTDAGWTKAHVDRKWRSQRGRGNADALPDALVTFGQLANGEDRAARATNGDCAAMADDRPTEEPVSSSMTPPPARTVVVRTHGQLHIAERFAEEQAGRLLYVYGIGWYAWDGKRWAEDVRGRANRAVLRTLQKALSDSLTDPDPRKDVAKCESASGIRGVLEIAQSADVFAKTVKDLDDDPYLLNCANGTLDLRTMELREHNPADLLTKLARGAWHPDEAGSSSAWQTFLERVLPDEEVRAFLRRYVGLALAGTVLEHALAILIGTGRNGKSVFYRTVNHALGDYASTAEPDLFVATKDASLTNTAGQMALLGTRWVVVSESDDGRALAEATVKRLTGGDTITARRLYGQLVTFEPSHTAVLVTNHLPTVRGGDPALWARLLVVPFDVTIPDEEQDPALAERLKLEADAVLAWTVAGYLDYKRRSGLHAPGKVTTAVAAYRGRSDAFPQFIEERCTTSSPALRAPTGALYDAYREFCASEGVDPGTLRQFTDRLDQSGYTSHRGTGGVRFREGIALRPTTEDHDTHGA
ncbi:phage/plasmid primase, P4 family [Prescottella equi]|uniref:phage/plasmid primase, P4 family n=1 Tax=Rhodococcus hoagii TaxID=43767 RepID=UPI000B3D756F|nr:phage/plasmid primase, P4 family [Prescottella equi]